eukprot:12302749-Prorocentrum_lima.AAC.1
MTSSLVGSEMCIRDRYLHILAMSLGTQSTNSTLNRDSRFDAGGGKGNFCLLYTSDAADDM